MSVEAMAWALNQQVGNATCKLVLVGFANHASRDGTAAFPSIPTVADYAESGRRTVQRYVAWLVDNGYMREGDQDLVSHYDARYRPIVYDLAMDTSTRAEWEAAHRMGANERRLAATRAGHRGAQAKAQISRGANLTPLDVPSNPADSRGADLTPLAASVRGDTGDESGVTPVTVRGDTSDTQTTHPPNGGNHPVEPSMSEAADATPDATPSRLDVERLCKHLADRIEANTGRRPTVGDKWRDAARLLIDRDSRTEDQVHTAIEWATNHDFWRSVVLSMPKLREKYDQLQLQAQRDGNVRAYRYDNEATWADAKPEEIDLAVFDPPVTGGGA